MTQDSGMTAATSSRYKGVWTAAQFKRDASPGAECTENPTGFHRYRYKQGRIYCEFCNTERV